MSDHRVYPITPTPVDDRRFSYQLVKDLLDLLVRHGYQPLAVGDGVELQDVVHRFLYGSESP